MSLVLVDVSNHIGTATFHNAEKRNCLSNALLRELATALETFERMKLRAIVIRAEPGAKVWSAGFDVRELPDAGRDPLGYNDPLEVVLRKIQQIGCPVLAMIEGGVWGGACDLALTCDIAVGGPTASFAMSPAKLGVPYNFAGILHFLNIVGPRVAREMFFTAEPLDAKRACEVGLLNHLVPQEELEGHTRALAERIAQNSPLAIGVIKEQLRILSASYPVSPDTFERIQGLRRRVYDSRDYAEGKKAFLEKRRPTFIGE